MNAIKLKHCIVAAVAAVFGGLAAWAEVALPSSYTPLKFVRSTGAQYVDTKYQHDATTVVDMKIQFTALPNNTWFSYYGSRAGYDDNQFGGWISSSGNGGKTYHYKGVQKVEGNVTALGEVQTFTDYVVHLAKNGLCTVNGGTLDTGKGGSSGVNDLLFAMNDQSVGNKKIQFYSSNRLYYCQIRSGETLVRDFIPCRDDKGEAGLWDRVEGLFYGSKTSTKLLGDDEEDVKLNWIESSGSNYIDTQFKHDANTVVDMKLRFLASPANNGWVSAFGARSGADKSDAFGLWIHNNGGNLLFWKEYGGSGCGDTSVSASIGTDYLVHLAKSGSCTVSIAGSGETSTLGTGIGGTSPRNDYLFCLNNSGSAAFHSKARLYYCSITSAETGLPTADMRPCRTADGTVCLYDSVRNKYLAANTGSLAFGLAYTTDGTTLCVHDGTLTNEDLGDCLEVRKVSGWTLNAAAVASYPAALTLQAGRFALADGEAKAVSVAGALTLHGGLRLDIDAGADACDRFEVGSIAFDASATAENPVIIRVTRLGIEALAEGTALPFVTGEGLGLTADDAQRFRVDGLLARVAVRDGALVLEPISAVADARWTGAAEDDDYWSSIANWRNLEMPMRGASVTFGETAGGASVLDLGAFTVGNLLFLPDCGSYTLSGGDALTVQTAITNASSSAQTLTLPMELGVSGKAFAVETAGELRLTDAAKTAAADEIVKGGAGTLVLNDEAVAGVPKVTVTNGTLKLNYTGRVTSAATAGEIRIRNGACLDVNCNAGNVASLARTEVTHGKTVYIEGSGPDGQGALVNTDTTVAWGCTFGHLVLAGDAASGGAGNLSVRPLPNSRIPGSRMEGPGTFSVKGPGQFNFHTTEFALGGIVAGSGSNVQFEGAASGTVTNGVTLSDGAYVRILEAATIPEGIPFTVPTGSSAEIRIESSTRASSMAGALRVDGLLNVTQNGSTPMLNLTGMLVGNGVLKGGKIAFAGTESCWSMAADGERFTEKVNVDQVTDASFLTGLKRLAVRYTGDTSSPRTLDVAPSGNLTQVRALNDIELAVTDADGAPVENCWLEVTAGNRLMLHIADAGRVRTAVWRGGANAALNDPANWLCSNDVAVVENGLPQKSTTLVLSDGCVFNCPAGTALDFAQVAYPATLGGDSDWRGLDYPIDTTVNLNGYNLRLSDLKGAGAIESDERYVEVEYIESTGLEYINTGYSHDSSTVVDLKIQFTALPNNTWFAYYGSRSGYDDNQFGGWVSSAKHPTTTYHYKGVQKAEGDVDTLGAVQTYTDYVVHLAKNDLCTVNDGTLDTGKGGTANRNDLLFALDDRGNVSFQSKNRLYYCRIYSGATLVRDFVPVKRVSDGAYGLIDRANGNEWYGNKSGAGAFVGPATEDDPMPVEVHIDVPKDKAATCPSLALRGWFKLVKEGEGTLTLSKQGQTYSGGTDVTAGTVIAGNQGGLRVYGAAGSRVWVRKDATFDVGGYHYHTDYTFVLDGGTLAGKGGDNNGNAWFQNVVLTADSKMTGGNFGFVGYGWAESTLEMNGHTLTIEVASGQEFYMGNLTVTGGGRIVGAVGGWLALGGKSNGIGKYVSAETTTLEVQKIGTRCFSDDICFGDYVASYHDGYTFPTDKGSVTVSGCFTPTDDAVTWYDTLLKDGATMNLSQLTQTFNTTCTYSGNGNFARTLRFEPNATIIVDFGSRRVKPGEVISWLPANAPADSVKFKLSPGQPGLLKRTATGVEYRKGMVIIFQ